MSFKTKFSISISLIVMIMFILFTILNEYFMIRNMNLEFEQTLRTASEHAAFMFAEAETAKEKQALSASLAGFAAILEPSIAEVRVFMPGETSGEIAYGTDGYREDTDNGDAERALEGGFLTRKLELKTGSFIKSFYSDERIRPYVVSLVYDAGHLLKPVHSQTVFAIKVAVVFILLVLVISYLISFAMLRPIKQILWKVNEVSLGRFQTVIQVKGSDELSLLALKVNAMSQNLGIYMDKLRKAFEDNRRMKEYLESFINHTSDAIHVVDLEGTVIQVNRAFGKLFGYEPDEALGRNLPLIPDTHRSEMRLIIDSLLAGKVLPAQETVRVSKAGEAIPVSVTVSPIRDSSGAIQAFASITRDMRSRNRMEELLRRSEKLTMVGELAAGVAHEIRNPLTTLRGFLQLQKQTGRLNPGHTSLMLSELDRINLIVGEFLILAKPQATKFERRDVREVFGEVLSLLDSEAHLHNIIFRSSFADRPCIISCEVNQLKQVFINLLKNAIEAMPGGGPIHINIAAKQGMIYITIIDEGVGIPEELLSKIGDPFVTGKESGTGLGMMISQRIIHAHNGTMDIKSQLNVGTTISVMLPALKEE